MVNDIAPAKLRWLAGVTGCLVATTSVLLQWTDPVGPAFLALSAAIQPRSPRAGRWLMWVSALSMNVLSYAIAVRFLSDLKTGLITLSALAIYLALALVLCCDVALVMDVTSRTHRQAERDQVSPGSNLDWLVWIAALVLSSYFFWRSVHAVRAYQLNGRIDLLLIALGLDMIALFFDIALIIHAVKNTRTE